MSDTQTPEQIIWSVLYGVLSFPEQDIPETVVALVETLQTAGYSILAKNNHVSKADLIQLADELEYQTEDDDIDYATGIGVAVMGIRRLANQEQS